MIKFRHIEITFTYGIDEKEFSDLLAKLKEFGTLFSITSEGTEG